MRTLENTNYCTLMTPIVTLDYIFSIKNICTDRTLGVNWPACPILVSINLSQNI